MSDQKTTTNLVVLADRRTSVTGADWSPREALLSMLADMDNGLEVERMIICYDGIKGSGFKNATSDAMQAIGLLQVTQLEVFQRGRE
jgi:hypothetical protein